MPVCQRGAAARTPGDPCRALAKGCLTSSTSAAKIPFVLALRRMWTRVGAWLGPHWLTIRVVGTFVALIAVFFTLLTYTPEVVRRAYFAISGRLPRRGFTVHQRDRGRRS